MKQKQKNTGLIDDYLESVNGMTEAATDPFFYTRLKARMDQPPYQEWRLPLKPVWLVLGLSLLLIVNAFIVSKQFRVKEDNAIATSSLQGFAIAYDLSISQPIENINYDLSD